jgi:hypothetical protein
MIPNTYVNMTVNKNLLASFRAVGMIKWVSVVFMVIRLNVANRVKPELNRIIFLLSE